MRMVLYKTLKKDGFAIFLYRILVIYIVFDGLRDNLIISPYITYFKESFTLLLFFYIFFIKKIFLLDKKFIFYIFFFFFLFLLIFFPFSILSLSINYRYLSSPIIMYYKLIQFFLLVYIFSVYEIVTKDKYENILKFFIKLLIIFVIITPIIYFTDPFFMVKDFKQWGRINIGYPTMDSENLVLGILLMLFVFEEKFFKALIIMLILILGIFMQLTATGFATLGFILIYYIFSFSKYKVNQKSIVFIGILAFIIISFIIYRYGDLLRDQLYLLQIKVNALLNPANSKSLSLRAQEFSDQIRYLNDPFSNLFGIGFKIYLENQYDWFRIGTGLIGFIGFIMFLSSLTIYGYIIRKKDRNILFLSSVIFAMSSYSLITLYLFPTEASFAMMIGYSIHLQRRNKIAKINNRF